jgi:hypothetical protein
MSPFFTSFRKALTTWGIQLYFPRIPLPLKVLLVGLLFPFICLADEWTTADTARQAVVTSLLIIDWGQTRYIAKNPVLYAEGDHARSFIGPHPSTGKVDNYFSAAIIGHAAVSYILPRGFRDAWQYIWIGAEIGEIHHNKVIGIRISF